MLSRNAVCALKAAAPISKLRLVSCLGIPDKTAKTRESLYEFSILRVTLVNCCYETRGRHRRRQDPIRRLPRSGSAVPGSGSRREVSPECACESRASGSVLPREFCRTVVCGSESPGSLHFHGA